MSGLRQQISESEGFASSIRASATWAENDGCVCVGFIAGNSLGEVKGKIYGLNGSMYVLCTVYPTVYTDYVSKKRGI